MNAVLRYVYGPPDVLELKEVDRPTPDADQVLIRVHAVSLNASDVEALTGSPAYARVFGLFRPRFPILGTDVSGIVEDVGQDVSKFRPGDEVMGDILGSGGALAEYACASQDILIRKPASLSFEQASSLLQSGSIALQGVRDRGRAARGHHVLINGAGGGSGTLAIQLAKHLGAEVTGVDNRGKLDVMRSVGADHVLDYAQTDFLETGQLYDLILDLVAHRSLVRIRRALARNGRYLLVGGSTPRLIQSILIGPLLSLGNKKIGLLSVRRRSRHRQDLLTERVGEGATLRVGRQGEGKSRGVPTPVTPRSADRFRR
jgi:NADPH:quinone reductase-like Zn-dependent oxidoreductase